MSNSLTATRATRGLTRAVEAKWFNAAPRVRHWNPTIEAAYEALLNGDGENLIELPDGAYSPDGKSYDKAISVLEAFNDWLGRNIVWEVLDWARDYETDGE